MGEENARDHLPGLNLWGFLTPPVVGAVLRAALVANCLRGALPIQNVGMRRKRDTKNKQPTSGRLASGLFGTGHLFIVRAIAVREGCRWLLGTRGCGDEGRG